METFHLFHLAACWLGKKRSTPTPISNEHGDSVILQDTETQYKPLIEGVISSDSVIRAASAQVVFAARKSLDFITPEDVRQAEQWAGIVCAFDIDNG